MAIIPSNVAKQFEVKERFHQVDPLNTDSINMLINNYRKGFIDNNFNLIRNSIGQQLIMINGNFSEAPIDWQAHQFLNDKEIDDWIIAMLDIAGPFKNRVTVKNINKRGNSAIVVTEEKGQNKFRNWENEEVVYMLGKTSQEWKIVGIFIKNLKNPD